VVLAADFLYLLVFYRARLFSDSLLQVFFVAFTLYGWWHWWRGVREEGEVRVVPLGLQGWVAGLAAGAVGAVLLGWLMVRVGAALPHLDAALASYSLVASWWQARKHTANWWLWIAVDAIYIGEYLYKNLWPTALLYLLLVILAVIGLVDWRRAAATVELRQP
jgi:nicotinamide mononucleotide transporter